MAWLDWPKPPVILQIFLAGNDRFREAYRVHLPLPKQAAVRICQHMPGLPFVALISLISNPVQTASEYKTVCRV